MGPALLPTPPGLLAGYAPAGSASAGSVPAGPSPVGFVPLDCGSTSATAGSTLAPPLLAPPQMDPSLLFTPTLALSLLAPPPLMAPPRSAHDIAIQFPMLKQRPVSQHDWYCSISMLCSEIHFLLLKQRPIPCCLNRLSCTYGYQPVSLPEGNQQLLINKHNPGCVVQLPVPY